MHTVNRRNWLKQSSLAALGVGISLRSMAGEDYLPKQFGTDSGLINLGSNENPYGISPKAKEAILNLLGEANRYPFNINSLQTFTEQLASHHGVNAKNVLVTAGSGEGLALLARHFHEGNIITATPTFGILPGTAKKIGTELIEIPLTADKVHDLDAMLKAITNKTSLVYICNPANPTSTILNPSALKDFCLEASKKTTVLIDEAYFDFLDVPKSDSMISLAEKNPNIIVIKTFSKIYAMAGLRVGFIISHPSVINKLEPNYFQNSQFAVSVLSQTAALASLADKEHAHASRIKNKAARQFTHDELAKLGYKAIPSNTNFIFFPLKNYNGDFADEMMKKNILLRSSDYSDGKWARVSVGTLPEMQQFIQVMKKDFSS